MIKAPKDFIDQVLWAEFEELDKILRAHLCKITDKIVSETIFPDIGDVNVVSEPLSLEAA